MAVILGALVLLAAGTIPFAYPAAAAVACPSCHGFEQLGPNLFVEQSMPAAERRQAASVVAEARTRVASFYGELSGSPRILVCDLPGTRGAWIRGASIDEHLYARAACRVSRWISSKGGAAAVTGLIGRVAQGADFDSIYR